MTSSQRLRNDESGFSSAIMLSLLALTTLFCLAFADAANVLVARSRAQAAADAASLAAATEQWPFLGAGSDPESAAERAAASNGAELESCDCQPRASRAVVVVSVRTRIRMLTVAPSKVHARASAAVDPAELFRPPP